MVAPVRAPRQIVPQQNLNTGQVRPWWQTNPTPRPQQEGGSVMPLPQIGPNSAGQAYPRSQPIQWTAGGGDWWGSPQYNLQQQQGQQQARLGTGQSWRPQLLSNSLANEQLPPVDPKTYSTGGPPPVTTSGTDQGYATSGVPNGQTATPADPQAEAERARAAAQADEAARAREADAARKAQQGGGGRQTPEGFRVDTPNGYGNPRGYYYNGHAVEGDKGQWIILPVQYNEAADTRRWEYNGEMQESTMRRAVRYAFDDIEQGRSTNFDEALKARLTQFYNEAGGQNVGYTLAGLQTGNGQGQGQGAGNDPLATGGGGGGVTDPLATTQGQGGIFNPASIGLAANNQRAAFDMYNMYTTGQASGGHGPFSDFYEAWFGPVAQALVNGWAGANGGQLPGVAQAQQLFSALQAGMSGGTVNGQDLFAYLSGLGSQAMQNAVGGPVGQSYDTLSNALQAYNPLMSLGMDPINRDVFYQGQEDLLRQMTARTYSMPDLGYGLTDWGQYFQDSPFYRRYYR